MKLDLKWARQLLRYFTHGFFRHFLSRKDPFFSLSLSFKLFSLTCYRALDCKWTTVKNRERIGMRRLQCETPLVCVLVYTISIGHRITHSQGGGGQLWCVGSLAYNTTRLWWCVIDPKSQPTSKARKTRPHSVTCKLGSSRQIRTSFSLCLSLHLWWFWWPIAQLWTEAL